MTGSLQVKNGLYYVVLNLKAMNGKRKQKWIATQLPVKGNKRKAEQRLHEMIAEYENSSYIEPSTVYFADFVKEWIEIDKPNIQNTTYDGYIHMLNKHIYPYFYERNIKLSKIKPMDIQIYYNTKLSEGLSPNTLIKHHAVIRSTLDYALKNHFVKENAADFVKKPKKQHYQAEFYNAEELQALFAIVKGKKIELPVFLAAYYGLRRSEIIGLKWSAIRATA